jgi:hypothetical protein
MPDQLMPQSSHLYRNEEEEDVKTQPSPTQQQHRRWLRLQSQTIEELEALLSLSISKIFKCSASERKDCCTI